MSGIAGIYNPKGLQDNSKTNLKKMIDTLQHRGPDGNHYYINNENGIGVAQSHLAINDLESKSSTIFKNGEQQVVLANGRFYDYKRIRTKLQMEGEHFVSKSDHELLLPLYKRHGLDFVETLRGEFALSLYDDEQKRLVLIRDRFGVKPLFYHIKDDVIYWASEVKALLAHPEVTKELSTEGLLHQLMQTMVPGTSAFDGIHAVKPGHMLLVSARNGKLDVLEKEYWDMNFPEEKARDLSVDPSFYVDQTRTDLLDAIDLRLDSDVPVGAYLSGGIDSCSILGMASSLTQKPLQAFTISFDNADYDESVIAKEMAQSVHADHSQIILSADDLYGDNYVNTVWHSERTFYNTLGVAKNLMSKHVKQQGCSVALTGEGADELFGGYPSFKKDMFRYGMKGLENAEEAESFRKLLEKTNKLFTGAILSEEVVSHNAMEEIVGFTPSWIQPWMQSLEIVRPLLHNDVLEELENYDPIEKIAQSFDSEKLKGRHVLDKAQYTWSKTMLECQILNWGGDRVDMANAMESRPPFLDHVVAENALLIPPHLRINGNTEKWVLREAMKNIIPETLYKREKFAFMAPPSHTDQKKRVGLQRLIDEYMNEDVIKSAGIFDVHRLRRFLVEYEQDKDIVSLTRKDALLNHIVGLHILWKQFISR